MPSQPRLSNAITYGYLLEQHGPLMHGQVLWQALGYVSAQAFRKAVRAGTVPIVTFTIKTRRGRFARTSDVAQWIGTLGVDEQPREAHCRQQEAKAS
jgi:hypothetical protein